MYVYMSGREALLNVGRNEAYTSALSSGSMEPTMPPPLPADNTSQETSSKNCCVRCLTMRLCFAIFVFLLVCSCVVTILFFIFAIFNFIYVYIGIGLLLLDLVIIAAYFISRRCYKSFKQRRNRRRNNGDYETGRNTSSSAHQQQTTTGRIVRTDEYRRLEQQILWLTTEIADLQANSLCNAEELERVRETVQRDYRRVAEWIEGIKTPEDREIQHVSRTLRRIGNKLQAIRMRSERITASLAISSLPNRLDLSISGHVPYPAPPPTYDESCLHARSHDNFALDGSVVLTQFDEQMEQPPPYDTAVGSPV